MISDEDELIESNSSESSPPRDTRHLIEPESNNEEDEAAPTDKFDKLFEKFVEANTAKSICSCFQSITDSLNINTKQIFENG